MDPLTIAVVMVALGWGVKNAAAEGARAVKENWQKKKEAAKAWQQARSDSAFVKFVGPRAIKTGLITGALLGTAATGAVVAGRGFARGLSAGWSTGWAWGNANLRKATAKVVPGAPGDNSGEVVDAEVVDNPRDNRADNGADNPPGTTEVVDGEVVDDTPHAPEIPLDDTMPCPVCDGLALDAAERAGCMCRGTGTIDVRALPADESGQRTYPAPVADPAVDDNEPRPAIAAPEPDPVPAVQHGRDPIDSNQGAALMAGTVVPVTASRSAAIPEGIMTYGGHLEALRTLAREAVAEQDSAGLALEYALAAKSRAEADITRIEAIIAGLRSAEFGASHESAMAGIQELIMQQASATVTAAQAAQASMDLASQVAELCAQAALAFRRDHEAIATAIAEAPGKVAVRDGYTGDL